MSTGAQSSFLQYSFGVLTAGYGTCLDVLFWLSFTELSLAQITGRCRIPWEVAQDTAEARGDSTNAVLGLVFHARRCATTGENCGSSSLLCCSSTGLLLAVLQIQFIARVCEPTVCSETWDFQLGLAMSG